jgi:phosphoribosylglycinamide formyltransferase-1
LSAGLPGIVVLISGRGSNLQSIIDKALDGSLPVEVRAVISNEPDAFGLDRARRAGIATRVLNHRDFKSREDFDDALMALVDGFEPGLVVLAGFMRILTPGFVTHYAGRLMNIHPSLLPLFPGLDTHQRAIDAGVKEHGVSVHFVTPSLDGGPIIIQARVPVRKDDDAETLAARVLEQEHVVYPKAIGWFAEGRLSIDGDSVRLDGQPALGEN